MKKQIPSNNMDHPYPKSWYWFCSSRDLQRGPVSKEFLGRKLVAFKTQSGKVSIINSSCIHMGSDLGKGCVVGESIQCPFHHWEYGVDGRCTKIPLSDDIPSFARQSTFPAEERHGSVFFFNGPRANYELPFYDDLDSDDLVHAEPFTAIIDCPWYMVGANAVDLQHFLSAHDRTLIGRPVVEHPTPFAHRSTAHFAVNGDKFGDRLLRRLAGDQVEMQMTDHASTLMLVRATWRRTRSYGMLCVHPLGPNRTLTHITVFKERSRNAIARRTIDPLSVMIRRQFIKAFLGEDIERLAGTDFNPNTLIEIDGLMAEYFDWLRDLANDDPPAVLSTTNEPPRIRAQPETQETLT